MQHHFPRSWTPECNDSLYRSESQGGSEKIVKWVWRCRLRGDLHLKLNQGFEVSLDKSIDTRSKIIISHNLYFLIHVAFVNKMYCILYGISICAYVGLVVFIPNSWLQGRKGWETILNYVRPVVLNGIFSFLQLQSKLKSMRGIIYLLSLFFKLGTWIK